MGIGEDALAGLRAGQEQEAEARARAFEQQRRTAVGVVDALNAGADPDLVAAASGLSLERMLVAGRDCGVALSERARELLVERWTAASGTVWQPGALGDGFGGARGGVSGTADEVIAVGWGEGQGRIRRGPAASMMPVPMPVPMSVAPGWGLLGVFGA